MNSIQESLAAWAGSQVRNLPVGGLISRNRTVYKWKAPFRAWIIREAVSWRLHDLLTQSLFLFEKEHGLGARILLRSALETLAILIYLNMLMKKLLDGTIGFQAFSDKTTILLMGSRDVSTKFSAQNILTSIDESDKIYPGIRAKYDELSESAHPNHDGLKLGYSTIDRIEYEANFENRWMNVCQESHLEIIKLCIHAFYNEYNFVWCELMDRLEVWIEENDGRLQAANKPQI